MFVQISLYTSICVVISMCAIPTEYRISTENTEIYQLQNKAVKPHSVGIMYTYKADNPEELESTCNLIEHEVHCNCSQHVLLNTDEYQMIKGSAYVPFLNKTFTDSCYEFSDANLYLCMCKFETKVPLKEGGKPNDMILYHITVIAGGISIIGLLFHLIYFLIVPKARTIGGYFIASLCASLLIGYLSYIAGLAEGIRYCRMVCIGFAFTAHSFILSSMFWMSVVSHNIYATVSDLAASSKRPLTDFNCKRFCRCGLYSWGVAFVISTTALVSDFVNAIPEKFKPHFARDQCWFNQLSSLWIFFMGPALAITVVNYIFFGLSIYKIHSIRMKDNTTSPPSVMTDIVTFCKLALIAGILWLSGFFARITDYMVLWYIFALSNALQGFLFCVAFTNFSKLKEHLLPKFKMYLGKPTATRIP